MAAAVGASAFLTDRTARALGSGALDHAAMVTAPAVRGAKQIQINPPPPPPTPPRNWDPGDFVMSVDVDRPMMAFSFDDGPSPSNTYAVLRALSAHDVKATFFLIGVNVRAYPQIARDIVSEGHELGNHSIYHTPYRASALANQIPGNNDIIQSATGVRPIVNRAPGLTRGGDILSTCRSQGMYETHTRMTTSDYLSPRWSASRLINQFSSNLTPGAIPVYHDGGGTRPTRDAVSSMLDIATSRGYQCTTITNLVNSGTPRPGHQSYSGLADPAPSAEGDPLHDALHDSLHDACQYDARQGLIDRLAESGVSAAERSRIVEQLAMLDDHLTTLD